MLRCDGLNRVFGATNFKAGQRQIGQSSTLHQWLSLFTLCVRFAKPVDHLALGNPTQVSNVTFTRSGYSNLTLQVTTCHGQGVKSGRSVRANAPSDRYEEAPWRSSPGSIELLRVVVCSQFQPSRVSQPSLAWLAARPSLKHPGEELQA